MVLRGSVLALGAAGALTLGMGSASASTPTFTPTTAARVTTLGSSHSMYPVDRCDNWNDEDWNDWNHGDFNHGDFNHGDWRCYQGHWD
ncbi:MAG: hypothetical protein ACRD0H_05730, partial [Actinomycetes bacterium]